MTFSPPSRGGKKNRLNFVSSITRPQRRACRAIAMFSSDMAILRWSSSVINALVANSSCKRNIEMTPLCKIEATLPRVLGSREVRLGGVVDEQAGVQPA
jgi:hypothetical protein